MSHPGTATVLASYGLNAVVTVEDDSDLWADALLRRWPPTDDPAFDAEALYFGTSPGGALAVREVHVRRGGAAGGVP